MSVELTWEATPNPQSLKFVLNRTVSEESLEITSLQLAKRSPLAEKILGFPWAKSVFLGKNFVTVTKEDWVEWDMLRDPLSDLIKEHLETGGKILLPKPTKKETEEEDAPSAVKLIKEILQNEIQPAVAMDGGFIDFVSYENKKVYLSLQGACSGCPSSAFTLKEGIEMRLKQSLPEIEEVVAV